MEILETEYGYISNEILSRAKKAIENDEVIIIPTDTVYSYACSIKSKKGIEKIARIKGIRPEKAHFSYLFRNLAEVAQYVMPMNTSIFRVLKKVLPGPYTFILNANNNIPKFFKNSKRTVGARIVDNEITMQLLDYLDTPLQVSSVKIEDEISEIITDPYEIATTYPQNAAFIIDAGISPQEFSTIVDATGNALEIIREGLGDVEKL